MAVGRCDNQGGEMNALRRIGIVLASVVLWVFRKIGLMQ